MRHLFFKHGSCKIRVDFVGIKMILSHNIEMPEWLSLSVIGVSLAGGIIASLLIPDPDPQPEEED